MTLSIAGIGKAKTEPARNRVLDVLSRPVSKRRTVIICAVHVALVWGLAFLVVGQNYELSVAGWKTSAENISLTVAAHAAQTQGAADLVGKSMADWVSDERIETPEQFRRIMGEKRFFEAMRDRIVGQPQIGVALIFAANGDIVNTTTAWPPPQLNVANRESFTSAIEPGVKTLALSATATGRISGKPRFFVSRKVVSQAGELLGVIAVGLESEFFADFYRRIALGPDSWLALFRNDGTLLATSLPDQPLGKRLDKTLPYRLIEAGQAGKAVLTKGPFPYYAGSSPTRIVVATKVGSLPAYVTVVVGESAFLTPWRDRNLLIFVIAAILTVLTVVAGLGILLLIERSAAAAREASERQVLAAIVDTPLALTAVVDRTGKVIHANSSFRSLLCANGHDDVSNALFNPALEGIEPLLSFVKGDAPLAEVDVQLVKAGDQTRRLRFSLSRQTLPDSGESIIMVGHDETLRHQAERAIAVSGKLVTLGEITTGIAHELSQPLNVIRMAAQNAQAEAEPQPAADGDDSEPPLPMMSDREFRAFAVTKLNRIVAQVDRAASIISRMRIFSRATREGPQSFDLRDTCRAAVARVAQSYRAAEIVLEEKLGEEPLAVSGHPPLLEQVLVSILANARDALADTLEKSRTVELSAGRGAGGRVWVRVADNGPGVPEAHRERIFEPFFTTKPEGQGAGLGLAVSYGIVRDAGGTLTLKPGGPGATFEIDLPGSIPS
ncbi:MAG: sensor histidine kinase [Reyranella sp.]|uniref:ATP-binding protein n=1 Tax=Reyranella sp. TaxID=1929291 RepID=UPI001220D80C|nr:ATP-binding protein [Reyranella sp.]TAJ87748.1 MAG: sensor histidine kinase [Reyranella sp.]TBR25492.1 MAG: sensor histidine kinase [Reyranella sp.]